MSIGTRLLIQIKQMLGIPPEVNIDPELGLNAIATKVVKMHAEVMVLRMGLAMAIIHGYGMPHVANKDTGEPEPLMLDAASLLGAIAFDYGQSGIPEDTVGLIQYRAEPDNKDKRILEVPKGMVTLQ